MSGVGLRCGGVLVEGPSCDILRRVWMYAFSNAEEVYEDIYDCQAVHRESLRE